MCSCSWVCTLLAHWKVIKSYPVRRLLTFCSPWGTHKPQFCAGPACVRTNKPKCEGFVYHCSWRGRVEHHICVYPWGCPLYPSWFMPSDSVSCPWGLRTCWCSWPHLQFEAEQLLLTYHCLDLEVLLSFPIPGFPSLPLCPACMCVYMYVCWG